MQDGIVMQRGTHAKLMATAGLDDKLVAYYIVNLYLAEFGQIYKESVMRARSRAILLNRLCPINYSRYPEIGMRDNKCGGMNRAQRFISYANTAAILARTSSPSGVSAPSIAI